MKSVEQKCTVRYKLTLIIYHQILLEIDQKCRIQIQKHFLKCQESYLKNHFNGNQGRSVIMINRVDAISTESRQR